ncbi:hypothetical protein Ddye_014518 [Dipteronia dyeriana]|uniref:Transposase MuDR plant domain-containing protein n=1 Tax=Dipteronia dyeriana TaxID=168575 RepID=A0AAD9X8F3_9ROSI|nr:hypothetical protein Ddye_014518 [Dipteronia dyeriana]
MDIFQIYITIDTRVVELGTCDADEMFIDDILDVYFSGFEQDLFGDNKGDLHNEGDNEDQVGLVNESGDNEDVVGLGDESDDDMSPGDEVYDAKLARVIKSNPFKQLIGCPIRFEVGQTHDNVYTLRSLLTDFAIHEGFNFTKVKNDERLTWVCMAKGCPWRIHASNFGDDTTMQVKTYKNEHACHMIYKSKEARSKWIAGKFQALVMSNPGIQADVISDLLRDQFNHLRAYAIMVQQCNSRLATYIHLLDKTITFQRMFVCFGEMYPDDKPICFMSDKQKGVIGALKMQWPRASIRRLVMSRFQLRKDECNTWKIDIPPSVNKKILESSDESRILKTLHSGGGKYEMLGVVRVYSVNLPEKTYGLAITLDLAKVRSLLQLPR